MMFLSFSVDVSHKFIFTHEATNKISNDFSPWRLVSAFIFSMPKIFIEYKVQFKKYSLKLFKIAFRKKREPFVDNRVKSNSCLNVRGVPKVNNTLKIFILLKILLLLDQLHS